MNPLSHGNLRDRRRGRFFAIIAAAMLTMASLGVSSNSSQVVLSAGQKFAGTWKAEHEGKTILVLELRPEQGTLAGTIRMMDFEMDLRGTGAVQQLRGGALSEPMPLIKPKLDGEHLLFEFKEDDDPDITHWRMDLIDAREANLQWIELPSGFKAQPFHLTKATQGHSKRLN